MRLFGIGQRGGWAALMGVMAIFSAGGCSHAQSVGPLAVTMDKPSSNSWDFGDNSGSHAPAAAPVGAPAEAPGVMGTASAGGTGTSVSGTAEAAASDTSVAVSPGGARVERHWPLTAALVPTSSIKAGATYFETADNMDQRSDLVAMFYDLGLFGFDLIALPVRAILTPPTADVTYHGADGGLDYQPIKPGAAGSGAPVTGSNSSR